MKIRVKNFRTQKKITGSKAGGILFDTFGDRRIQVFLSIFGFDAKPQLDDGCDGQFFTLAGKAYEKLVFDYYSKNNNYKWRRFEPSSLDYDQFKDNKIFGGLIDGVPTDNENPFLEIKTKSFDKFVWEENPETGIRFLQFADDALPKIKEMNGNISNMPTPFADKENCINIFETEDNFQRYLPSDYKAQIILYMYLSKNYFCDLVWLFLDREDYKIKKDLPINAGNCHFIHLYGAKSDVANHIGVLEQFHNNYIETQTSWELTIKETSFIYENFKQFINADDGPCIEIIEY